MERKTKSLYGRKLQSALQHDQPMLQSEELPAYLPFFVQWDLLNEIHNNTNHLIVGRRGTGKTHLLGAFDEYINSPENHDELSIMISLARVSQTPPTTEGESPEFVAKKMAKLMYQAFLRIFFQRFLDKADSHLKNNLKIRCNRSEYKSITEQYNSLMTRLLEAIELGRSFPTMTKRFESTSFEGNQNGHLSGNLNAGVTNLTPTFDIEFGIGGGKGEKENKKIVQEVQSILAIDLAEIRDLILKVIQLLQINTLYILIDEWMELDKNTPSSIQATFAQLLKEVFFNHKLISVKIASIWHQTTLYDKKNVEKSKGVELGHDIQLGANLDTTFLSGEKEVFRFCKELLFKRLKFVCKSLEELEREDGTVDDIFITEIFDNTANFRAFIAASHGIPRDLMKIFQKCSLRIKRDFEKQCIDYTLVSAVARDLYKLHKRKTIDPNSSAQAMLRRINTYMETTGRRLFLVANEDVVESRSLRKLVDEELIHQIPSGMTHRKIRDTHKAYHIDYGNYVDWIEAQKKDLTEILDMSVLVEFPESFSEKIKSYVISVVEESQLRCKYCNKTFLKSNPVYTKLGGCPYCGEKDIVVA